MPPGSGGSSEQHSSNHTCLCFMAGGSVGRRGSQPMAHEPEMAKVQPELWLRFGSVPISIYVPIFYHAGALFSFDHLSVVLSCRFKHYAGDNHHQLTHGYCNCTCVFVSAGSALHLAGTWGVSSDAVPASKHNLRIGSLCNLSLGSFCFLS